MRSGLLIRFEVRARPVSDVFVSIIPIALFILLLVSACDSLHTAPCSPGCEDGNCDPGDWVTICSGTFVMGSPLGELGRSEVELDETLHDVTLTHGFVILSTEVTVAEFEAEMGYDVGDCDDCPADGLTWHQAAAYTNALSESEELLQCYVRIGVGRSVACAPNPDFTSPYDCPGYRLPTEAEFEYAARAGTTAATYAGDLDDVECSSAVLDPIGWYCGNSEGGVPVVGGLEPNPWGLFDMLGNAWEWCNDGYDEYPNGSVVDPWSPPDGPTRVLRGGGVDFPARSSRAANRGGGGGVDGGVRPVRTIF